MREVEEGRKREEERHMLERSESKMIGLEKNKKSSDIQRRIINR
jgi:hypothetical protein